MGTLHENFDIIVPMDSWNPNFHSGSRKNMGIFVMNILFPIYYVLHD